MFKKISWIIPAVTAMEQDCIKELSGTNCPTDQVKLIYDDLKSDTAGLSEVQESCQLTKKCMIAAIESDARGEEDSFWSAVKSGLEKTATPLGSPPEKAEEEMIDCATALGRCPLDELRRIYANSAFIGPTLRYVGGCQLAARCITESLREDFFALREFKLNVANYNELMDSFKGQNISDQTDQGANQLEEVFQEDVATYCHTLEMSPLVRLFIRPMTSEEAETCPFMRGDLIQNAVYPLVSSVHQSEVAYLNNKDVNASLALEEEHKKTIRRMCTAIESLKISAFQGSDALEYIEEWCPHLIIKHTEDELDQALCNTTAEVKEAIHGLMMSGSTDYATLFDVDANCKSVIDREITTRQQDLISKRAKILRKSSDEKLAGLREYLRESSIIPEYLTLLTGDSRRFAEIALLLQRLSLITDALAINRAEAARASKCERTVIGVDVKKLEELKGGECRPEAMCEQLHVQLKKDEKASGFYKLKDQIAACESNFWVSRFNELRKDIDEKEKHNASCDSLVASAESEASSEQLIKLKLAAVDEHCEDAHLEKIETILKQLKEAEDRRSKCDLLISQSSKRTISKDELLAEAEKFKCDSNAIATMQKNIKAETENTTTLGLTNGQILGTAAVGTVAAAYMNRDKLTSMYNSLRGNKLEKGTTGGLKLPEKSDDHTMTILLVSLSVVVLGLGAVLMFSRRS